MRDDEDDYDDRPRKKKRRRTDDEETGWQKYKRSPVRFAVLGVLVVGMLVLAYFLYQKLERQGRRDAARPHHAASPPRADYQFVNPVSRT
jgi:hypothetical protein